MLWNVDPWRQIERMRREMDNMLSGWGRPSGVATFPLVNMYDDKEKVIITAELPGLSRENVAITFTDGVLTLSGKQDVPEAVRKLTVIRQERSSGQFEKSIRIPTKVVAEKISATFKDGILTIVLPKAEEAKPRQINIEAK